MKSTTLVENLLKGLSDIPEHINAEHWQEWLDSAVDPEIISLNVKSLEHDEPYDYLIYSSEIERTNTGALTRGWLNRYNHLYCGGWWCAGIDVLSLQDSLWGCFKPDERYIWQNGKDIKYEHPPKINTEIFALKVPSHIWKLIGHRYSVELPENYQSLPYTAFWQWVIDNAATIPIIVTEGAKKAASLLSCGYVAIGLPGIFNGIRQPKDDQGNKYGVPYLIEHLKPFAKPDRRFYFAFDADNKRNTIRNVNASIAKTSKLLISQKCSVNVITWNPVLGKGIDDVIHKLGTEQFDYLYSIALPFDQWQTKTLKQLTYHVNLELSQRYLGDFLPPADAQFIVLKAPKSCGKTHWLSWYLDPILKSGERKVLLITHRVQLGLPTAKRIGIPYISENAQPETFLQGYGLCINSLHPKSQALFNPSHWRKAIIVLDEIQQLIWHILTDPNCKKERVAILKTFKELLQIVISSGGKIIIADADLNDIAIDFIKQILEIDITPWIVQNNYKFEEPWKIHNFTHKNPATLLKTLENKIASGEKALLLCTGQKPKAKYGSQSLEKQYQNKFPELKILRIDSETVSDKTHPAYGCASNINEVIKDYDLVIATPTIETGVSIETEHFDGVWGIFQGIQTTDSVRQFLARYRVPVPRYIWINSVGINRVGNGSSSAKSLMSHEYRKDKAIKKQLCVSGFEENLQGEAFSPFITAWAKLGALVNLGMQDYRNEIITDLASEGHHILDAQILELPSESEAKDFKAEIIEACQENYAEHNQEVSSAETINDIDYETLKKQREKTKEERLKYRKARLERSYPGVEITPEIVQKDDKDWFSQIKLHYFYTIGREFVKDLDILAKESELNNGNGDYFILDSNRSQQTLKIATLDLIGFDELLAATEIHENHEVIQNLVEKVIQHEYHVKLHLNLRIDKLKLEEESKIQFAQRLVKLIGYKFPCLKRVGTGKNRTRIYGKAFSNFEINEDNKLVLDVNGQAIPIPDQREKVWQEWLKQDKERIEKSKERKELEKMENDVNNSNIMEKNIEDLTEQEIDKQIEALTRTIKIQKLTELYNKSGDLPESEKNNLSVIDWLAIERYQELLKENEILAKF